MLQKSLLSQNEEQRRITALELQVTQNQRPPRTGGGGHPFMVSEASLPSPPIQLSAKDSENEKMDRMQHQLHKVLKELRRARDQIAKLESAVSDPAQHRASQVVTGGNTWARQSTGRGTRSVSLHIHLFDFKYINIFARSIKNTSARDFFFFLMKPVSCSRSSPAPVSPSPAPTTNWSLSVSASTTRRPRRESPASWTKVSWSVQTVGPTTRRAATGSCWRTSTTASPEPRGGGGGAGGKVCRNVQSGAGSLCLQSWGLSLWTTGHFSILALGHLRGSCCERGAFPNIPYFTPCSRILVDNPERII